MKRFLSAIAIGMVLSAASSSWAQSQIYLVDISKVFKAYGPFNEEMAKLKAEADQCQAELQSAQQSIAQKAEALRTMDPATDAYRDAESALAQSSAQWEVSHRAKLRDLMQRESTLHFNTYVKINELIGTYCTENQVPIVIRFSSEPMSLEDPESIMQTFNNSVVYFSPRYDITDAIIQRLNGANGNQQP